MKVAVTAEGSELDSRVDPRFGRCACFLFVELDDLSFEAMENPSVSLGGGAGIQSAQIVSEKGAEVVITGNVGPNAYRTLEAAGLQVVTGASGTVRQAVEAFKSGALAAAGGANVESHFGMGATGTSGPARVPPTGATGQGPGAGSGPATGGMGGGMGGGTGGGMGRGMGRGGGGGMGGGGGGRGMGRGMGGGGGGRGMGRGMGGGMGGGMGMGAAAGPGVVPDAFGTGTPPQYQTGPAPPVSPEQEIGMLRSQAEAVAAQLQAINARIAEVERGTLEATTAALVAVVDAKLCDACGQCVEVCPKGAIAVPGRPVNAVDPTTGDDVARIDKPQCNGCARCVAACPRGAISLHKA